MSKVVSPPADEPADDHAEALRRFGDTLSKFAAWAEVQKSTRHALQAWLEPVYSNQIERLNDLLESWPRVQSDLGLDAISRHWSEADQARVIRLFEARFAGVVAQAAAGSAPETAGAETIAVPVAPDVALFMRLVDLWQKMWNDAGRYGPAGLKVRRTLIVFLALIIVTFVLEVAVTYAHLTDHQLAEDSFVAGVVTLGVTVAKK